MSKNTTSKPKKRKTRLKGTETRKPCVDCGRTRDRFKHFKPRWAGCVTHRSANGRRYYQDGCEECDKLVNGNIRQPRCVDCDKKRPKKSRKKTATPTPTPEAKTEPKAPEPKAEPVPAVVAEPVTVAPVKPEPKTETKVEAKVEASPESTKLPEPEPEAKPVISSMDDLSALFGGAPGA